MLLDVLKFILKHSFLLNRENNKYIYINNLLYYFINLKIKQLLILALII